MRIAVLIVLCLRVAAGCTVVAPPVKDAVKQAQVVFRGMVTEISDSEITFRVDRVWKGPVTATFSMPKVIWSSSGCLPGFYQGIVKVGAELLVYARRVPEVDVSGYIPTPGSRTAPVANAADDLKRLGRGHQPK